MPKRIQMKRTKGWRKPAGAVYVGRPTRWGNMHKVGDDLSYYLGPRAKCATVEQCVELYRIEWEATISVAPDIARAALEPLAGRDLGCWCQPGAPCHADTLLELANR